MNLSIKGKQVDIGAAFREHVETTLPDSIGKYFDNATDVSVTLSKQTHEFEADIQAHVSKRVLVQGSGRGGDAYAAFEEASEHVLKRLRRYKRRLKDYKHRLPTAEAIQARQYILQPESDAGPQEETSESDQPIIVAEMESVVETMSVGEATMQMDLTGQSVMLFRNSKHGGINLVYQRPDGNIGWVDPKLADEA